jgi:hypothetical protein
MKEVFGDLERLFADDKKSRAARAAIDQGGP